MRRKLTSASLLAGSMLFTLLTGCLDRPQDIKLSDSKPTPDNANLNDGQYHPVRGARAGHVTGTVGPVALDHATSLLSAYDDGYYLSVEAVVDLNDRAAMTLLSISNGQDIFKPGLNATYQIADYDAEGVGVTMLGCVGQEVGIYDEYDMPADEVDVHVEAGEVATEADVQLEARWYERNDDGSPGRAFNTARTEFTLLY